MSTAQHQEKLNFQAEVKQLLHIVVHSLYSNKEIFLRELISNAADASDKLRYEALANSSLYENDPELKIHLSFDKEARTITLSDNGIGMSREEVIENLGTIAKSGTREFLSRLTGDQKKDAHLIGQFGVGFYSAFMVAEKVVVRTRRAGAEATAGVEWESTGDGAYSVADIAKTSRGTEIMLHLKAEEDDFLDDWRLRSIITKYSDHLNLPIYMPKLNEKDEITNEWEAVNKATALWSLAKNKIKDEEYKTFYKHIAHDFADPLAYTHHHVEGNIDYTALLYIPSQAPFDLWQQDAERGLKLYVERVFIMDKVAQFLPHYLRFIRGVLDTKALSLNISREILQDHPAIPKLRAALVRHVLDLLERLAKDEPQQYTTFWQTFGAVLKEGPAEDFANRTRIAKLLRFHTTHSQNELTSLDDYIQRMKPNQKKIYYVTAENFNAAKSSPHLEIFNKHNVEVLLLGERIDEWLVAHLSEYESKTLQSIAKGEVSLEEFETPDALDQKIEADKNETQQQAFSSLLQQIKNILGEKIKEVRLSQRLTTSAACLVREDGALGVQMERLLKAAGQPVTEAKPILEINPEHAIIRKLQITDEQDALTEWSHILYEQALLTEGSPLPDPAQFVQRMNKLWVGL